MKRSTTLYLLICTTLCCMLSSYVSAQTTIADNGKSTFTIIVPAKAPSSVQDAASEFQKDIKIATGAELPLQKDSAQVTTAIISLGDTQQAKSAGFSSEKMASESFRIVTKDGNLYILGPDTPDKGWTENNGTSNGTANGVYTFLEDYLDVRWLMPGKLGRDVPPKSTLTVESIDRSVTPRFSMRRLTMIKYYANISQTDSIKAWSAHQKQGGATNWDFGHNWWRTINRVVGRTRSGDASSDAVKKLYDEHPDWFAMDKNGKRPFPINKYGKLETTNPELVKWFAEQAIAAMKESNRPIAYSLSPSDGSSAWSQSPESKALYDENPDTGYDPESPLGGSSMSSLVLKWYHDIAKIVEKEYPQGRVTGYLYSTYVQPPQKVSAKLPDNFTPQIAPSRVYGYGLYRDDVQKYFSSVMDAWADIVTGDWFYYDLPNVMLRQDAAAVGRQAGGADFPGGTGNITPPGAPNANIIYPQLIKSHINGTNIYGSAAWSSNALTNYILAKMNWDPTLNAIDVQREWLNRAYGAEAGAAMDQLYTKLDDWYRDYYQQNEQVRYELNLEILKDLYGVRYPEMDKLFLQAKAQPMTAVQKQRLRLIEDNLIVLQWRLRNLHYLSKDFISPLQRSDLQISDLIATQNADFALFPGVTEQYLYPRFTEGKPLPWKVRFANESTSTEKNTLPELEDSKFLIYAAKDGDVRITTQMVTNGAFFASYSIKNQNGGLVTSGVFNTEKPIKFPVKAGETYMMETPLRKPSDFQLQVEGAALASGDLKNGTLQLSSDRNAPVYIFYVPGKEPVGILDHDGGAKIRKPHSADLIPTYMKEGYAKKNTGGRILNELDEGWLFSPDPKGDGLQRGVTEADFDDSSWASISPLDWWQTQDFTDYHGPAWYRIKFKATALKKAEVARLFFGAVDGNTVVYLNGKKIGEHLLGEGFAGWDKAFTAIATRTLQAGENTLVVQVTSKSDTTVSGIFKPVALIAGVPR